MTGKRPRTVYFKLRGDEETQNLLAVYLFIFQTFISVLLSVSKLLQ